MKILGICAAVILIAASAAATTVVRVGPMQSCSSSPNTVIAVTQLGRPVKDVRVDVYQAVGYGERLCWTGVTDARGAAKPRRLEAGNYRVFANSGTLDTTLNLVVSDDNETLSTCELKLVPPSPTDPSYELGGLVNDAPKIDVKRFQGVAEDEYEAVIPRLKIKVLRLGSSHIENVTELQTDEKGQFTFHLGKGIYAAIFDFPGFRKRAVILRVDRSGWQGFRVAMVVAGTSTHNPLPKEWNAPQ